MKKFRKRLVCLLLAAVLLCSAMPTAGGAVAGNGVIFLAVNDSIPVSLAADTMPFYSGGTLYVPWTLFNVSALGITPSYNVLDGKLTLFNLSGRIVFDLEAGTSTDSRNTGASWSTITKSSILFVPAEYCVTFFGVGISYLTSAGGYSVVRFTTGDEVYTDAYFLEKADSLLETRALQYFNSGTSQSTAGSSASSGSTSGSSSASSSGTASGSASAGSAGTASGSAAAASSGTAADTADTAGTQTDPDETQAVQETPEEDTEDETEETDTGLEAGETEEPEEAAEPADAYLLYYNAEGMEALAEELEARGLTGAFFLTAAELEAYPNLLTRLQAGGHSVGILLEDGADAAEALQEAGDLADRQTRHRLLWVYTRDAEAGEAAAGSGYLVLTPDSAGEDAVLIEADSLDGTAALDACLDAGQTVQLLRQTTFS